MIECFIIAVFTVALYWKTLFFHAVVDDLKNLEGKTTRDERFKSWFQWKDPLRSTIKWIHTRLYGSGTFPKWGKCRKCFGKGEVLVGKTPETAKVEKCSNCLGVGESNEFNLKKEHALSIFFHASICCLMYLALGHDLISFCAALLYSANPTNTQTAVWLNGRRYALNIILVLLMMLSGPWGLGLWALTPMFQVNAIFASVLLGGWWWGVIPLAVALNWKRFVIFYKNRMKSIVNDDMNTYGMHRIIVSIKTYGFYIIQMVVPRKTLMIYPFIHFWGINERGNKDAYKPDGYFFFGLVCILGSLAALVFLKGQMFYWFLFMVLALGQWCNIITATQTSADRYVALVNVFAMYFVVKGLTMLLGGYALPVIGLLLGYYIAQLNFALVMYKDIQTFYDYHNFHDPANVACRKFEANWKLKAGDPMAAWEILRRGLYYNPDDFTLNYQAGVVMQIFGEYRKSEEYFDRAEKNNYINQEKTWAEGIARLRATNRHYLNPPSRIVGPGGNGHKIMDFARKMK